MQTERSAVLAAWWSAKWARLTLATRRDIERRQARLWREMVPTVDRTPAVQHLAGKRLEDFPIVTPAEIRADFERWNTLGLTRAGCEAAARDAEAGGEGEAAPGVAAGFSTGTAGERGLFLSDAAERAGYLGLSLARLLPTTALLAPQRIGLVLRADNRLYRDVERAGPFRFRFFGLDMDPGERAAALAGFEPDVLIAPAHVLAELAKRTQAGGFDASGIRRLFWGAEPMGVGEREWIAAALGVQPDPIYQATEGFLGAPCREGVLHLNEDALIVEREPVPGTTGFRPVVTDLRRTSQPIIRVRLDDLLEPLEGRCACGSPLQAIRPVEGRVADVWRWGERTVRPAEVWAVMEKAVGSAVEWRAEASPDAVSLTVEGLDGEAARAAVQALAGAPVILISGVPAADGPKRRRVRWRS